MHHHNGGEDTWEKVSFAGASATCSMHTQVGVGLGSA